jgi:hypothetical protein
MLEEGRFDPLGTRSRALAEAQCVIGDVYRNLTAYQEGVDNYRRAQRFLTRLLLANEDMREWAANESERPPQEDAGDPDFAQLLEGVKEAAEQIQRSIGPLLRQARLNSNSAPSTAASRHPEAGKFPPAAAPLLANILSCLALRAQAQGQLR